MYTIRLYRTTQLHSYPIQDQDGGCVLASRRLLSLLSVGHADFMVQPIVALFSSPLLWRMSRRHFRICRPSGCATAIFSSIIVEVEGSSLTRIGREPLGAVPTLSRPPLSPSWAAQADRQRRACRSAAPLCGPRASEPALCGFQEPLIFVVGQSSVDF